MYAALQVIELWKSRSNLANKGVYKPTLCQKKAGFCWCWVHYIKCARISHSIPSAPIRMCLVTISCLFLRFVLIFKGNVLENVKMCLFLRNVLIFDFLVEKIRYCGREDLFFFFFFFWSSPIFSGKTDKRPFFFSLLHNKELLTFW